jgi:hypothetical protein
VVVSTSRGPSPSSHFGEYKGKKKEWGIGNLARSYRLCDEGLYGFPTLS